MYLLQATSSTLPTRYLRIEKQHHHTWVVEPNDATRFEDTVSPPVTKLENYNPPVPYRLTADWLAEHGPVQPDVVGQPTLHQRRRNSLTTYFRLTPTERQQLLTKLTPGERVATYLQRLCALAAYGAHLHARENPAEYTQEEEYTWNMLLKELELLKGSLLAPEKQVIQVLEPMLASITAGNWKQTLPNDPFYQQAQPMLPAELKTISLVHE